jgi:hypothetical protein
MTNDAITYGQQLQAQIANLMAEKATKVADLAATFPALTTDDITALAATVGGYYDTLISAAQTAFTNLAATYTK